MSVVMPLMVNIRLTHACLQILADDAGLDLLHIKGPALSESLLASGSPTADPRGDPQPVLRQSVDADVLIRPEHVDKMVKTMREHGWTTAYGFNDGSPFAHASAMEHPTFAPADVHRAFPGIGIDAATAFERLWQDRSTEVIAGVRCSVPSIPAQRLIIMLHALRSGADGARDVRMVWLRAMDVDRRDTQQLAVELDADVPLAIAAGRDELVRSRREYELWAALARGETSLVALWLARVRASRTNAEAARTAIRLLLPKPDRLAQELGRRPTAWDLVVACRARALWGARELMRYVRSRIAQRRRSVL